MKNKTHPLLVLPNRYSTGLGHNELMSETGYDGVLSDGRSVRLHGSATILCG